MRWFASFVVTMGVIAGGGSAAHAFQPRTTGVGELVRWTRSGELAVAVAAPEHSIPGGARRATEATRAAFQPWFDAMPMLDVEFDTIDNVKVSGEDKENTVVWYYEGWNERFDERALAMTVTTYGVNTGAIFDADIAINAERYEWTAAGSGGCSTKFDLQNVLTHEVGHFIGLGHESAVDDATMFPTAAACETQKRDLADDDIGGVTFLYLDPDLLERLEASGAQGPGHPLGGCSASGDDTGGWLAVALLALAGASLRRRSPACCRGLRGAAAALVATVSLVAAGVADASTLAHVSLERMATEAALVVEGRVVAERSRWDGGLIVTEHTVEVTSCWSAGPCPARVVVEQLGGEVGEVGMSVEGTAPLAPGDDVVLFLQARGTARYAPVGMAQGAFSLVREPGQAATLRRTLGDVALVDEMGRPAARIEQFSAAHLRKMVTRARLRK